MVHIAMECQSSAFLATPYRGLVFGVARRWSIMQFGRTSGKGVSLFSAARYIIKGEARGKGVK